MSAIFHVLYFALSGRHNVTSWLGERPIILLCMKKRNNFKELSGISSLPLRLGFWLNEFFELYVSLPVSILIVLFHSISIDVRHYLFHRNLWPIIGKIIQLTCRKIIFAYSTNRLFCFHLRSMQFFPFSKRCGIDEKQNIFFPCLE